MSTITKVAIGIGSLVLAAGVATFIKSKWFSSDDENTETETPKSAAK